MSLNVNRRFSTVAVALAVLAIPTLARAHGGNPDANVVHACIGNVSKVVRIVGVSGACIASPPVLAETAAHWDIQGPQGPTGSTGPVGPKGNAGPAGATGAQGPQGTVGGIGPSGPAGAAGPAGATGPQGPTGSAGPAGPSGAIFMYKGAVETFTVPAGVHMLWVEAWGGGGGRPTGPRVRLLTRRSWSGRWGRRIRDEIFPGYSGWDVHGQCRRRRR